MSIRKRPQDIVESSSKLKLWGWDRECHFSSNYHSSIGGAVSFLNNLRWGYPHTTDKEKNDFKKDPQMSTIPLITEGGHKILYSFQAALMHVFFVGHNSANVVRVLSPLHNPFWDLISSCYCLGIVVIL